MIAEIHDLTFNDKTNTEAFQNGLLTVGFKIIKETKNK